MAHSALFEHVKLRRLMKLLSIPRPHAIGYLECLVHWASGQPPYDGDLSKLSDDEIEAAAEWDGESGAFVSASIEVRLIDRDERGTRIHDFTDWCPVYVKMRRKRHLDAHPCDNVERTCNTGDRACAHSPNSGSRPCTGVERACNGGARTAPGGAQCCTDGLPSRAEAVAEPNREEQKQPAPADNGFATVLPATANLENGLRSWKSHLMRLGADEQLANEVISLQPLPALEVVTKAMREQAAANARGNSHDRSAVFRRILHDNDPRIPCKT